MKYLILFFTLFLFSCRNHAPAQHETGQQTETKSPTDKPKDSLTMRLVIDFYSIASGIDYNSMIAYEDSLGSYSGRLGKNIDYLKKPWGREGETEICMRLNELTPSEQKDFVIYTRNQLKTAKWVNIYENALCRH